MKIIRIVYTFIVGAWEAIDAEAVLIALAIALAVVCFALAFGSDQTNWCAR